MERFFDQIWVQNTLVVFGFALVFGLIRLGTRNERWQRAFRMLRRDRIGILAGVVIAIYLFIGALEMIQVPSGPSGSAISVLDWMTAAQFDANGAVTRGIATEKSYSAPLADRSLSVAKPEPLITPGRHLLGTDALGKDTLVQTLKACRTALIIGGLTSAIYIPVGALLGVLAGYYRRWVDDLIQFLYSTMASIPDILFLVAFLLVLGKGLGRMSIALGITGWVGLCRLIRGEVLRQSERQYVAAARSIGQSHWKIITRHLLPNVMHLILINFVLGFSGLVLVEAILSYLGVGAPLGTASWGAMINGARSELSREPVVWWNITAATTALFFLVLSLNLFGDALRRAFDPRQG
jgi:peptide/nickel transport system permease protein